MPAVLIGLRKSLTGLLLTVAVFIALRYLVLSVESLDQFAIPSDRISTVGRIVQALDAILSMLLALFFITILFGLLTALFLATYLPISYCLRLIRSESAGPLGDVNIIMSVAVTALFFSSAINGVFRLYLDAIQTSVTAARDLFVHELPNQLKCIGQRELYQNSRIEAPECLISAIEGVTQVLASAVSFVLNPFAFASFDIVAVVLAFAFFVMFALAIKQIRINFNRTGYFWLGYAAIAAFSVYLSLTAILAVPLLTSDRSTEEPRPGSELQASLQDMLPDLLTAPREDDSETTLDELLEDRFPDPSATNPETGQTLDLLYLVSAKEADRKTAGLLRDVERLRSEYEQRLRSQLSLSVNRYSLQLSTRLGEREAASHFLSMNDWFQDVVDTTTVAYSTCEYSVETARSQHLRLAETLDTLVRRYNGDTELGRLVEELNSRRVAEEFRFLDNDIRAAERACTLTNGRYAPPNREEFGTSLGIAGFATGWLLGSENLQVALITGLIGFGLLGALLSLFVRLQVDPPEGTSAESTLKSAGIVDICVVVFVGFGAALVVYLLSYGGLEIVGTGNAGDPNPYIVFATAFAGATFSKPIWLRARNLVAGE